MKKTYIAPEINVMEMEMETALMGLSSQESLPGTSWGGESEGGGMDADANDRRGGWGNLWD